jgi:hypothetical protein
MVKKRYSTKRHQIILDLIMIFIEIPRLLIIRIVQLTALPAVTHLAEVLALARCGASDTEWSAGERQQNNVKNKTESERIYRFLSCPINAISFLLMGISDEYNVDSNVRRI